jgi:hypothetical protein
VSGLICLVKGCALSVLSVFLPGQRRKKNAVHIGSAAASEVGSVADWVILQA